MKSGFVEFMVAALKESVPRFRVAMHEQGRYQVNSTRAHESARERTSHVLAQPAGVQAMCLSACPRSWGNSRRRRRSVEAAAEYRPCYERLRRPRQGSKPGAPAEYRRRLCFGKVVALRRPLSGLLASRAIAHVATLLPNPSLERRPREAGRPWAAQGSRKLHCPARPKGAPPHGSPQLER
jgi:hypothetical protein